MTRMPNVYMAVIVLFAITVIIHLTITNYDFSQYSQFLQTKSATRTGATSNNKSIQFDFDCSYGLLAYNIKGMPTSATQSCVKTDAELLSLLTTVAMNPQDTTSATGTDDNDNDDDNDDDGTYDWASDEDRTVSVVIRNSDDNSNTLAKLETLAFLVDKFLEKFFEWRIIAERFEDFNNASNNSNRTRSNELFYDPAIFINVDSDTTSFSQSYSSFAVNAAVTRRKVLQDLGSDSNKIVISREKEEEILASNHVDFILVRVLDDKLNAVAAALRRSQFPQDCDEFEKQTYGRVVMPYASPKEFLGAMTTNNVRNMQASMIRGLPFVNAAPPLWARVYHFENCTEANGYECAFLPIYGGSCIKPKVDTALKCLARFQLAYNQKIVLPKNGVPQHVCDEGSKQSPPLILPNEKFNHKALDVRWHIAESYVNWCPTCDSFSKAKIVKPSPATIANPDAPLGYTEISLINGPIINHMNSTLTKRCALEATPLKCFPYKSRTCCIDEISIPQNMLHGDNTAGTVVTRMIESALSSFMTRFNRKSRHRIANLHQPRTKAMDAKGQGWEAALAKGNCATLHIRRGDNMDRCANGSTKFCSMNLTLADYMHKAEPMLKQLDHSKHVFVMTDDAEVVAADKLKPWEEKGYFLEVVSGYNQYSTQTYDDWDPFIESLHAAKACRALVGHHISTVSRLVFNSICTRFGECPIVDMMEHPHNYV